MKLKGIQSLDMETKDAFQVGIDTLNLIIKQANMCINECFLHSSKQLYKDKPKQKTY